MSYVPYHPDVWPPAEPEIDLRPKIRALRWACGIVLYLLLIAGWVYWMKLPPRIKPPLATIHLADGTELRLVDAQEGTGVTLRSNETFDNRIHARSDSYHSRTSASEPTGGIWLAWSHYHPRQKRFSAPNLDSIAIREEGSPYLLRPARIEMADGDYVVAFFPAVPRRASSWEMEVQRAGATTRSKITNPLDSTRARVATLAPPGTVTSPKPAPLPQELQTAGFTARLEKVTLKVPGTPSSGQASVQPALRVTHPTARPGMFQQSYEWFDPSGNRVKSGILPWTEPVWGLRLKVTETATFPVSEDRLFRLGTVLAPGPGQAQALPVPPDMAAAGITDVLLIGAGSFTWSKNRLMAASGARAATPPLLRVKGMPRYGSISESAWGIYLLSSQNDGNSIDARSQLRVRQGDVICTSSSSGTSTWNNFRQQHFGSYRHPKTGPIPAGTEVTIDAFTPATHNFDFLFPRPELPPGK